MSRNSQGDSVDASLSVDERWWVDSEKGKESAHEESSARIWNRFFKVGEGYEQDRVLGSLTNQNLQFLNAVDPPAGEWGYLALTEGKCSKERIGQLKRQFPLPKYARGVVVDCDGSLRLLVSGTPLGERILEMSLGDEPAFDCWVRGEWISEALFPNEEKGLAALRQEVKRYLSPESVATSRAGEPSL